ncbi:hypothetical protein ACH5RR_026488 [Cinchona calisaya]|uniref:MULE transposase domain-containing protein n=1 Tax=Cinchona calisaya TaxID=153742 RepID=A0ABD2Z2Q7_9GENT
MREWLPLATDTKGKEVKTISKIQGLRTKKKALERIIGNVVQQYAKLEDYVAELLMTNAGSTILTKIKDSDIDRFQSLYPVAYVIIEIEKKDAGRWFLLLIIEVLHIEDSSDWVIVIDRQKSLCPAIHELVPNVEHRHCVIQLYNNFNKENPRLVLRQKLWKNAKATYEQKYRVLMNKLKKYHEKAYAWLSHECAPCWTRSHFKLKQV